MLTFAIHHSNLSLGLWAFRVRRVASLEAIRSMRTRHTNASPQRLQKDRWMATDADHVGATVRSGSDIARRRRPRGGILGLVPGFIYILLLYVIGQFIFPDPRASLFDIRGYQLSWVEVLLFAAAIVAMAEQVKVARPGISNTTEVLLIGATAVVQILLFALGAAKVPILSIFDNTEFLLLTLINVAQTAVAHQINAVTLMRTISSSVD